MASLWIGILVTSGSIISAVVSAASTLILGGIAAWTRGVRKDFRRFMTEHLWLLETTRRNSETIAVIMQKLGIGLNESQSPPILPTEPVNHPREA